MSWVIFLSPPAPWYSSSPSHPEVSKDMLWLPAVKCDAGKRPRGLTSAP
jgi:hypothetical protein